MALTNNSIHLRDTSTFLLGSKAVFHFIKSLLPGVVNQELNKDKAWTVQISLFPIFYLLGKQHTAIYRQHPETSKALVQTHLLCLGEFAGRMSLPIHSIRLLDTTLE